MTSSTYSIDDADERFVDAVRESYGEYNEHGARSTKKLRPLHQWVADEMQAALGDAVVVHSLRKDGGKEKVVAGKYYDKTVDVSISKAGAVAPLAIVSVKFITSNFKQNANNYFEHLMGETANIRRSGVGFGHFMVLPEKIPYLKRNGDVGHTEVIGDRHLQKYVALSNDRDHPHRPDVIGIGIISLKLDNLDDAEAIRVTDLTQMNLTAEIQDALTGKLSVRAFIRQMQDLVRNKVQTGAA